MDGYEVCTALKKSELTRDIPVFFLSAQGDTKNRVQGLDIGADDFIQKPFNPDELFARIRARMRIAELEKENRHLLAAERAVNERLAAALAELKERTTSSWRSSGSPAASRKASFPCGSSK